MSISITNLLKAKYTGIERMEEDPFFLFTIDIKFIIYRSLSNDFLTADGCIQIGLRCS